MVNNHINELVITDELFRLIQKDNFVGWVFSLDYDNALVVTNDAWKYAVKGIPHNAFLLASTFTPDNYADVDEMDREVILLRVMGSCKLPQDDDAIKTKLDSYQNLTELYPTQGREDFDAITNVDFNKTPSSTTYGNETYYGQDFLLKTMSGKLFVFNAPYPFPNKDNIAVFKKEKANIEHYSNIGAYARLIEDFESDLYESAVVPIALAQKYTAISLQPGGKILDILVQSAIQP